MKSLFFVQVDFFPLTHKNFNFFPVVCQDPDVYQQKNPADCNACSGGKFHNVVNHNPNHNRQNYDSAQSSRFWKNEEQSANDFYQRYQWHQPTDFHKGSHYFFAILIHLRHWHLVKKFVHSGIDEHQSKKKTHDKFYVFHKN